MSSVAVIGAGAIGGAFAAWLCAGGHHDVIACVRRPFDELVVESADRTVRARPRVVTDPEALAGTAPVDWVLVATKAHQTSGIVGWLDALVGPRTRVALLQNGVEHRDRLRPHVEPDAVVPTVVYCGAEAVEPGRIVHRTHGFLIAPDDEGGRALAALFAGSDPAEVRLTADWLSSAWTKLTANVVANGITALTGRRLDVVRDPAVAELGRALAGECLEVAAAEGARIDPGYADLLLDGMAALPDGAGSSMLYDRQAGRSLEWNPIHGAVLRAADRHGIDVPRTATVAALLSAVNQPVTGGPVDRGAR